MSVKCHVYNYRELGYAAPVESHKTNPRLYMNWSIPTSLADTPFPHNLEIAGSNPQQGGIF